MAVGKAVYALRNITMLGFVMLPTDDLKTGYQSRKTDGSFREMNQGHLVAEVGVVVETPVHRKHSLRDDDR